MTNATLVTSTGSNSVWVERSNSTCGIRIEERDDDSLLVGTWTAMAVMDSGGARQEQERIIRSAVDIAPRQGFSVNLVASWLPNLVGCI